jgi:hypothetical protein
MPAKDPSARLFDLMLLGLTWAQEKPRRSEAKRQLIGRTGHGVLLALETAGVINEQVRQRVTQDPPQALRNHVVARAQLESVSGKRGAKGQLLLPTQRQLSSWVDASKKLIVVLTTTQLFASDLIFGPRNGYPLFVTALGQAYAHSIADEYSDLLTQKQFLEAWRQHNQQVSAIQSKKRPSS